MKYDRGLDLIERMDMSCCALTSHTRLDTLQEDGHVEFDGRDYKPVISWWPRKRFGHCLYKRSNGRSKSMVSGVAWWCK